MEIGSYIDSRSVKVESNDSKSVPNYAYRSDKEIKRINIPSDIETIGTQAFYNCSHLEEVNFPEQLKTIGDSAFTYCENLTDIELPEGLEKIGNNAFNGCYALKSLTIPNSVTQLGERSFSFCSALKEVNLPNNIKKIPSSLLSNSHLLKRITIPNSVQEIGDKSFSQCYSLKLVKFPEDLKILGKYVFESADFKRVVLPKSVEVIAEGSFLKCTNLKKISLGDNLRVLGESAFEYCRNLRKITIPSGVSRIEPRTFLECSNLKEVKLPNVSVISEKAFMNCEELKKINIPETLTSIGNHSFYHCIELSDIDLPDAISQIDYSAFEKCYSLRKIKLPNNLTCISESIFRDCRSLESIIINDKVLQIQSSAFRDCRKLKNINLPDSLEYIGENAFSNCENLVEIEIPKNVKIIESGVFHYCYNLKRVILPEGLTEIKRHAFKNCTNLEIISIPSTVKTIGEGVFKNCSNLKEIHFSNDIVSVKGLGDFKYFTKTENGFILSHQEKEGSIKLDEIKLDPAVLSKCWKYKEKVLKEQNNQDIANFYDRLYINFPRGLAEDFAKSHNFTFFKQFDFNGIYTSLDDMYKFMYNLGVFSEPIEVNGKKIDYAQKVSGFLQLQIDKRNLNLSDLSFWGSAMKIGGLNPEFTEFFINNFDKLRSNEAFKRGFIARCYNEFTDVQKTNTSNRGSQRQLKATVEKFEDYFNDNKFSGIDDSNRHIKDAIAPYTSNQTDFDRAVAIDKERQESGVLSNIVGKHLAGDKFETIDFYSDKIIELQEDTLCNLTETANKEFTYDWLEKNDPQNFILGKLCSCCAHLSGVGYGIMRASIIHPDVQNLVIRDKDNCIIAKSTLYVNREQGYGVFNNVEIAAHITREQLTKIYKEYVNGVKSFVIAYNEQNKNKPLNKINVGMGLNDLEYEIINNAKKSLDALPSIDYGLYSQNGVNYHGDSSSKQYTIWEKGE